MMYGINNIKQIISSGDVNLIRRRLGMVFDFDCNGFPNETDGQVLYYAQHELRKISKDLELELMFNRFYKDSASRYEKYTASNMVGIGSAEFLMGIDGKSKKYLGEEPQHIVRLSSFEVGKTVVTRELYHLYDSSYCVGDEPNMPATDISWFDAVMFAAWIDCRLLTEAEWEYACRGGSSTDWCCETENELKHYAWYSNSSNGYVRPVGLLKPNQFGLYDMHGNVWEWCLDGYEERYYDKSPEHNPVNNKDRLDKVCRGGSMHAFAEMCRSSFRHSEPPDFKAGDIGFRLARTKI
ncbi:MAG: hypothetical protein ACD_21C00246G0008 [uncultured bacterium]|nr:MAG: hypothetical protein ACD_21C00246G0008 [uncultured bacterium]